jgi:thioredoxin-like negative regulator of GroEL
MTAAASPSSHWQAICLCAAWCGVCRDWDRVFRELAHTFPHVRFAWVDVEDEADAMGDLEIETFPTLLVAQDGHARFLGPVQPMAGEVSRLLKQLIAHPRAAHAVPTEAHALLHRLQSSVLPKS